MAIMKVKIIHWFGPREVYPDWAKNEEVIDFDINKLQQLIDLKIDFMFKNRKDKGLDYNLLCISDSGFGSR